MNLFQVFLSWFVFLGFLFSIDDLTEHWKNLSLSKREGPGLSLKEEQAVTKFILAVKFLTKQALNFEAIANTFQPLWRSRNGFKIENLGNHIALFIFYDKIEIDKILASEPWSFYKHLMVLQCYDQDMPIRTMKFNVVNFWVQVHDIPICFRTKPVVEEICSSIGLILHLVEKHEGVGGGFIRVRVAIDILQPLCHGRLITLEDGQKHWVSFQ